MSPLWTVEPTTNGLVTPVSAARSVASVAPVGCNAGSTTIRVAGPYPNAPDAAVHSRNVGIIARAAGVAARAGPAGTASIAAQMTSAIVRHRTRIAAPGQ